MSNRNTTPAEIVRQAMDGLARSVRKLLIENPNFMPGRGGAEPYHFRNQPRTAAFVPNELRSMAEIILASIEERSALVVAMAAEPEVPGLVRSYEGEMHGMRVRLAGRPDGTWGFAISDPHGFDGRGDVEADLPDEAAAVAAAREYARTGEIPEALLGGAAPRP
jgi:hypothetical protein